MNTIINQLELISNTHSELTLVLHENNILIYKFEYSSVFATIEINLGNSYPYNVPSIKIIESSDTKIISKGLVPGQFEMDTLDLAWDHKLSTVVNELVVKLKQLVH